MSSYRGMGGGGPWDGGPPGAEADYAPPHTAPYAHVAPSPQPPHRALPTTDPWTGVSYTHYGQPPTYDYNAYGAHNAPGASTYGYNYDSNYYQRPDGSYYDKYPQASYNVPPQPTNNYDYPVRSHVTRSRSASPHQPRNFDSRRRSHSRSTSPYVKKERAYSRKRDSSYEQGSRKYRSRSRSLKSKRARYSSSDHSSSQSRASSRVSRKDKVRRKSFSSPSSGSEKSYKGGKTRKSKGREHSVTSPARKSGSRLRKRSRSFGTPSEKRSDSRSPRLTGDRSRGKDKRQRDVTTPPRKQKELSVSPKTHKKSDRSSLTPPRSYKKYESSTTPAKSYKHKDRKSNITPPKKRRETRESSLTPPKSYARSRSSSSGSHSRSPSPKYANRRSPSSRSGTSSNRSSRSRSSRSKSHRSRRKSSSDSRSKSRSVSKSRTKRRRSKSKGKKRSQSPKEKSKSRSLSSQSRSPSGGCSEDERRGQFTVADRKKFWKLHRSREEERKKEKSEKTPPKEVKPPPGAVESTRVDDVQYGDPPEVEGPNFAELLSQPDLSTQASTSKPKPVIPIKNDGSFLEMFKKMQEVTKTVEEKKPVIKKPVLPFIGKRRGGRVLKTGLVKKAKAIDEQPADNKPKDAWSLYMQEVKKYRETSCEEERKTRPLVK